MKNLQNFRTMSKDKMHLTVALDSIESLATLVKGRIVEAKSGEDYKSICLDVLESLAIIPTIIDTSDGIINQTDAYIEKLKESHNKEIIGITKNITDSAKSLNIPSMEQVRKMYASKVNEEELNQFAAGFVDHLNLVDVKDPNELAAILGGLKRNVEKRETTPDAITAKVNTFVQSIPGYNDLPEGDKENLRNASILMVKKYGNITYADLDNIIREELTSSIENFLNFAPNTGTKK